MFNVGFRTGYNDQTQKRYYTTNESELIIIKKLNSELENLETNKTYYYLETADIATPVEKLKEHFNVKESFIAKSFTWSFRVTALEVK